MPSAAQRHDSSVKQTRAAGTVNIISATVLIVNSTRYALQALIPWVMGSFSEDETGAMIDSLRQATKNTRFDAWMGSMLPTLGDLDPSEDPSFLSFLAEAEDPFPAAASTPSIGAAVPGVDGALQHDARNPPAAAAAAAATVRLLFINDFSSSMTSCRRLWLCCPWRSLYLADLLRRLALKARLSVAPQRLEAILCRMRKIALAFASIHSCVAQAHICPWLGASLSLLCSLPTSSLERLVFQAQNHHPEGFLRLD